MKAHTFGPWQAERVDTAETAGETIYDITDDEGVSLIESACFVRDDATNARNLAVLLAAPDLLAALQQLWDLVEAVGYVEYLRPGVPERDEAAARRDQILDEAAAAITKATGEYEDPDPTGALADWQSTGGY